MILHEGPLVHLHLVDNCGETRLPGANLSAAEEGHVTKLMTNVVRAKVIGYEWVATLLIPLLDDLCCCRLRAEKNALVSQNVYAEDMIMARGSVVGIEWLR
jgi:hypothetical protein